PPPRRTSALATVMDPRPRVRATPAAAPPPDAPPSATPSTDLDPDEATALAIDTDPDGTLVTDDVGIEAPPDDSPVSPVHDRPRRPAAAARPTPGHARPRALRSPAPPRRFQRTRRPPARPPAGTWPPVPGR